MLFSKNCKAIWVSKSKGKENLALFLKYKTWLLSNAKQLTLKELYELAKKEKDFTMSFTAFKNNLVKIQAKVPKKSAAKFYCERKAFKQSRQEELSNEDFKLLKKQNYIQYHVSLTKDQLASIKLRAKNNKLSIQAYMRYKLMS